MRYIIIRKTSNERDIFADAQLGRRGRRISDFPRFSSVFLDSFPTAIVRGTY